MFARRNECSLASVVGERTGCGGNPGGTPQQIAAHGIQLCCNCILRKFLQIDKVHEIL